jgi:hypothetical protein
MTPEQQIRLCQYSDKCEVAAASISAASRAVEELARDIGELMSTMERGEERESWDRVRFNCFSIIALLGEAAFRFEKG